MIVMKFGGVSLATPNSLRRVVSIVRSHVVRDPIVVVSALGDTTDHLLEILTCASRADAYLGWKSLERLQTYHFCLAEDLLSGSELTKIETYLRQIFRDLHIRMLELSEGERPFTPELQDWVVSLGEQLSSRIVAAVLLQNEIPAVHMDARNLILTDQKFTRAEPRYWETYARIRWALPLAARGQVPVLGGFIGATEDGCSTTLGRGGSDLTASLVGAAINAEEVQVWKDVDGLLTWDPKVHNGKGYRLKQLSFEEMADLASAGAAILHPSTVAPVQRLRIPVTIRNTFRPECEGTTIGGTSRSTSGFVKSIACKKNVTLLELRSSGGACLPRHSGYWESLCRKWAPTATLLGLNREVVCLSLESDVRAEEFDFDLDQCTEVHIRCRQAIITLVGEGVRESGVADLVLGALASSQAVVLPPSASPRCISIAVPAKNLTLCLEALGRSLFTEVDPDCFAKASFTGSVDEHKTVRATTEITQPGRRRSNTAVLANRGVPARVTPLA